MSNKRSTKQENQIAKELVGGFRQPGSGCFSSYKQDVRSNSFLVEAKYTDAKSFSIKSQYWEDIKKNAFEEDKLPVLIIEFSPKVKLAVLRYEEFLELDRYIEEEYTSLLLEDSLSEGD